MTRAVCLDRLVDDVPREHVDLFRRAVEAQVEDVLGRGIRGLAGQVPLAVKLDFTARGKVAQSAYLMNSISR